MSILGDNLNMNPIPEAVKPIMDIYANKDSFTKRPIETMGMERLQTEYRFPTCEQSTWNSLHVYSATMPEFLIKGTHLDLSLRANSSAC